MSDLLNETEIDSAVEAATSEDNFDALSFFAGASLPEDSVTIYANANAAYKLSNIAQRIKEQKERDEDEGSSITDEVYYPDEDEVAELKAALKASSVVFNVRGLAPAAREAIEKKVRATFKYVEGEANTEYNEALSASLIANTITSVTNAAGRADKNKWNAERVAAFAKSAPDSEYAKLYLAVLKVNYIGDAIDQAVSADFS